MKVTYLVDYENVHESGISEMKLLPPGNAVYIFYTENADKICLDCFDRVCAEVHVIKVPAGKQSLDLHLVSFLGYLLGAETDLDTKYVIISNDTDFCDVTCFWSNRYEMPDKITRRRYIGDTGACENPMIQPEISQEDRSSPKLSPRDEVRSAICQMIRQNAEKDNWGCRRIQLSLLCEKLNHIPAYREERKRCSKKPQQFLGEEFPDLIRLGWENKNLYAYAVQKQAEDEQPEIASEPEREDTSVPEIDKMLSSNDEQAAQICEKQDIEKQLVQGGMDPLVSAKIAPAVHQMKLSDSSIIYLYDQARHLFGNKQGTLYYHQMKEILRL